MSKYLLFFLVCIGMGGLLFYFFSLSSEDSKPVWTFRAQEKQIPMTYAESLTLQKETLANDTSIYNNAVASGNSTGCLAIADMSMKVHCQDVVGASFAQKSNDPTLCQKLSESGSRMNCEDGITLARAESSVDSMVCGGIHEENLRVHCQKMIDEKRLTLANASGSLSPELCQSLHEDLRQACKKNLRETNDTQAYNTATQSHDMLGCDGIYNDTIRDSCRDAIALEKALTEGESTTCNDIRNPEKKLYCMSSTVRRSDSIAFQQIVAQGSIEACDTIHDSTLKDQCHDMVLMKIAREQKDSTVCASLRNTGMQFPCVQMTK